MLSKLLGIGKTGNQEPGDHVTGSLLTQLASLTELMFVPCDGCEDIAIANQLCGH